jgi:hypothetical protein
MGANALPGSFWPSERQKLLLRAALVGGDESADAWRRLRPRFRLDDLDSASTALLPLLYRQLECLGIDDPLLPRLRGVYRRTWYVNQLLLDRLVSTLRAVQAVKANPVVVSSWELPGHYYGDSGLRSVAALHLLVRPHDAEAAEAALAGDGWTIPLDRSRSSVRFEKPNGDQCVLYWQLFHEFSDAASGTEPEDLWEPAVELTLASVPARALGPADELLNVCLSGARANVPPSILWVADAVSVLGATRPEVNWERLVRQARKLRATLRLRDALIFLRDEVDAAVPGDVIEELEATPAHGREVFAHRAGSARLGLLGSPPQSLIRFLRVTAGRPLPHALAGLPSFLRDEWGLERRSQVPLRAARKGAARVARAARAAGSSGGRR